MLAVLSSCTKYGDTSFKWLEGRWEQQSAEDTVTEIWAKQGDGQFQGTGMYTRGGQTEMTEQLALERKDGTLYYVASVPNQNNGQPVYFKYQGVMNNTHIFENKEHDFPQRIIYRYRGRKGQDSLFATVEGIKEGKKVKFEFKYGRVE